VIFWEKLRTELGRYADGVHEVGPPNPKAKGPLGELYKSFDGVRLFTDSYVIFSSSEIHREGDFWEIGEAQGAPLYCNNQGRIFELDDAGDRILAGSDVAHFIDACLSREKFVVDREGEFKDVFVEGGELNDDIRKKRVKAGLKADPDSAAYHLEAAEIAFEEGREDEARHSLERAVELDPDAGAAWTLLAGLDERAQKIEDAAHAYQRAAQSSRDPARRAERFAEAARLSVVHRDELAKESRAADRPAGARWLDEAKKRLEEGDPDGALRLAQLAEAVGEKEAAELVKRARVKSQLKVF
jgi:tetratricopeptide (TPR) repeat protein